MIIWLNVPKTCKLRAKMMVSEFMTISNSDNFTYLQEQVDELQSRQAYQEDTIQALNNVIVLQDAKLVELQQQLQYFQTRLKDFIHTKDNDICQKPPHY